MLSPIFKPQSNIYCVGWNYLDHFDEGKDRCADQGVTEYPKVPVLFTKGTQTMNGPFDSIPYDGSYSTMIDWEAELAVVIGKKCKNISEENAMDYVLVMLHTTTLPHAMFSKNVILDNGLRVKV